MSRPASAASTGAPRTATGRLQRRRTMGKPGNGHGLALPEPVAEALQLALQSLQGGEAARVRGPDNEGALNHVFLIETPRGGAVFRMRREASSEQIFDYLDGIYRCTA